MEKNYESKSNLSETPKEFHFKNAQDTSIRMFAGDLLNKSTLEDADAVVWPEVLRYNNEFKIPLSISDVKFNYDQAFEFVKSQKKGSKTPTTSSSISHAELITKEFEPIRYLVEPFFEQGTMNMLSAPPNSWKSWLFFIFAGSIASGSSVFNKFETKKTNVMIVNEEDSIRSIQDRMKLLDIVEESMQIFYRISCGSKLTEELVSSLLEEAKEKNIGVIMFDSLRAIHSANENDSQEMQIVMDLFKKITKENITVIFTHHHRKKSAFGKNDDAEASRGSTAINAAISGHLSLEEINNDEGKFLLVRHLKSKAGEKLPTFEIGITVGEKISFNYLGEHKASEKLISQVKEKIVQLLDSSNEWLGKKDFLVTKIAGDTTLRKALNELVQTELIVMMKRSNVESKGLSLRSNNGRVNENLYQLKKEQENEDYKEFKGFIDNDF